MDYLFKLEENNLFKMNLLQEQQQSLDKTQKECEESIAKKKAMVQDVDSNIALLKKQKQVNAERLNYYKSVIDANNAEMEGKIKSSSSHTGGRQSKTTSKTRDSTKTIEQSNGGEINEKASTGSIPLVKIAPKRTLH